MYLCTLQSIAAGRLMFKCTLRKISIRIGSRRHSSKTADGTGGCPWKKTRRDREVREEAEEARAARPCRSTAGYHRRRCQPHSTRGEQQNHQQAGGGRGRRALGLDHPVFQEHRRVAPRGLSRVRPQDRARVRRGVPRHRAGNPERDGASRFHQRVSLGPAAGARRRRLYAAAIEDPDVEDITRSAFESFLRRCAPFMDEPAREDPLCVHGRRPSSTPASWGYPTTAKPSRKP